MTQKLVVQDILAERKRQDTKWGEQNHTLSRWLDILIEEVGEYAKAILPPELGGGFVAEARKEMVQVAAVAIAAIENIDRAQGGEMGGQPKVAAERFAEMLKLELVFPDEKMAIRQWIGECVGAIYLLLQTQCAAEEDIRTLGGFGKAMWQAGYEAAANVEFVLPEGAEG